MRLMPCWARAGPIGGAGLALPALIASVTTALTFFAITCYPLPCVAKRPAGRLLTDVQPGRLDCHPSIPMVYVSLRLLHLQEVQFDRCFPSEEGNHDAHFGLFDINVSHGAGKVIERPINDTHALAHLEGDFDLGRFLLHAAHDGLDFFWTQGRGFVTHAYKARDAGRVAYHVPTVFVHFHLDEDVTRKYTPFDGLAFTFLDFNLFFRGYHHVEDFVLHSHRLNALFDSVAHLIFVARIAVNDVPLLFLVYGNLNPFTVFACADEGTHRPYTLSPLAGQQVVALDALRGAVYA